MNLFLKEYEKMHKDIKGFTLSEVLITLVIIGILAVITIPTLLQNIWNSQQKSQFKKAYTTMYNAFIAVKADLGYVPDCYYDYSGGAHTSECLTIFSPTLKNHLNIIKTCVNNSLANGCIPNFVGLEKVYQEQNSALSDSDALTMAGPYYNTSFLQTGVPTIVLGDGIYIMSVSNWNSSGDYIIDINGQKPPNKWGYDIFQMQMRSDGDKITMTGSSSWYETGGKTFSQMLIYAFQ